MLMVWTRIDGSATCLFQLFFGIPSQVCCGAREPLVPLWRSSPCWHPNELRVRAREGMQESQLGHHVDSHRAHAQLRRSVGADPHTGAADLLRLRRPIDSGATTSTVASKE
jgi:hypothetical protein